MPLISSRLPQILSPKRRKSALDALPTMGGQTALNTAISLAENGTLEKFDVQLIGADLEAINKAEDRLCSFAMRWIKSALKARAFNRPYH